MFFKLKTVITENGMYKVSEHKREILYKFCRADFFTGEDYNCNKNTDNHQSTENSANHYRDDRFFLKHRK